MVTKKVTDSLLGDLPEKTFGFKVVARWVADCGTFPSPRMDTARVVNDVLVADCNHCSGRCLVYRHLKTVKI